MHKISWKWITKSIRKVITGKRQSLFYCDWETCVSGTVLRLLLLHRTALKCANAVADREFWKWDPEEKGGKMHTPSSGEKEGCRQRQWREGFRISLLLPVFWTLFQANSLQRFCSSSQITHSDCCILFLPQKLACLSFFSHMGPSTVSLKRASELPRPIMPLR